MKDRCLNPQNSNYERYGARGIKICEEWLNSFENYYSHVTSLPNALRHNYILDRIDSNGDYKPGNLRWASMHTQTANRRKQKNNTTGYTGVFYDNRNASYYAQIEYMGSVISLGVFTSARDAAIKRDKYIIENNIREYPLAILSPVPHFSK